MAERIVYKGMKDLNLNDVELAKMIGERIKARRDDLNMGPGEMSDKLKCSAAMVTLLEQGKRMPSVPKLYDMARVLKCSTDYLLGLKGGKRQDKAGDEPAA